jgi:hypothetical protein
MLIFGTVGYWARSGAVCSLFCLRLVLVESFPLLNLQTEKHYSLRLALLGPSRRVIKGVAAVDIARFMLETEDDPDANFDPEEFIARMPPSSYVLEQWFKDQRGRSRTCNFYWHSDAMRIIYVWDDGVIFGALDYLLDTERAPDWSEQGFLEFKFYGQRWEHAVTYFARTMTMCLALAMTKKIHAVVANSNGTKSGIGWQVQRLQSAFDAYQVERRVEEAIEPISPDDPEEFVRQHLQAQDEAIDQFEARIKELGWAKHPNMYLNEYHYRKPTTDRHGFIDLYITANLGTLNMRGWGIKDLFGYDVHHEEASVPAEWEVAGADIPIGMSIRDFAEMADEEALTSANEPDDEQFGNYYREPNPAEYYE